MTSKITYFIEYFKFLKNPISCLLFKFGIKHGIIVNLKKDDLKLKINEIKTINYLMEVIRSNDIDESFIKYMQKYYSENEIIDVTNDIKIYNPRLYELNLIFTEYFLDYYSNFPIDYNNRVIIDIGANSGDTALYFASKGAEVYAFEPVKEYYEMALKNFELNSKLSENIKIYNKGVSYKTGKISIDSLQSALGYIKNGTPYEVDIISLESVMDKIKIDLLKMDCEGCEFEIIENTDLSSFNEIIFEYHSKIARKNHEKLIKKLENEGFTIKISSVFNYNIDELGLIYAYKTSK